MKITVLVDNTTKHKDLESAHGLSLYIEVEHHKILFDLGPDRTFLDNAQKLGIDTSDIDTEFLSIIQKSSVRT